MLSLLLALAAPTPMTPVILGTWHNPKNSVAVKTGACGERLCGWIVRASDKAKTDAKRGGVDPLIGTALLRDYRANGRNRWSGTVFIPDMGRTFGSTVQMVDTNTINVKGCLIGGFICKSQVWTRD